MGLEKDQELYLQKLGMNLRKIRREKKISQEKLADRINTERSQISRIERGIQNPRITTLVLIARELDVDLKTLITIE